MDNLPTLPTTYLLDILSVLYCSYVGQRKPGFGARTMKCCLYSFVWISTKTVHLEPINDLATRFVFRQGLLNHAIFYVNFY